MDTKEAISEQRRETPVLLRADIIVGGAGPAGVVAAIAAAREGTKVVLIERYGSLGGNLTIGLNTKPSGPLLGGIPKEIWRKAQALGAAGAGFVATLPKGKISLTSPCDPEVMKIVLINMCLECGVKIIFESQIVAPIMVHNKMQGIIIECKEGRRAILGNVIIDATGDGDIAALSGAPFQLGSENGKMQPVSLYFKMGNVDLGKLIDWAQNHTEELTEYYIPDSSTGYGLWISGFTKLLRDFQRKRNLAVPRENITLKTGYGNTEMFVNATRVVDKSGLSILDISEAIVECYKQIEIYSTFLKDYIPGFECSYISAISPMLGVRETRHIRGEYCLSGKDVLNKVHFDDSIGLDNSALDIHDVKGTLLRFEEAPPYEIPYRCLVPQKVGQLLIAGRCISTDHMAHGRTRNIPECMLTGQAAGAAAALAVKDHTDVREINISRLQEKLREYGMPICISEIVAE